MPVHVLQAMDDPLISFEDAQARASEYAAVWFSPTEGAHNNYHAPGVQNLILAGLKS